MRRVRLFALGCCSAFWLTLASTVFPEQTQTTSQQPQSPSSKTATKAAGQQSPRPPAIPPGMRLLSLKEGRTLAENMAWADDEEGLSPDCSHLVHTLYEQAGYAYPYASSTEIYHGTGHFLRVRYPHPGDLIVWPGHIGVVVDPAEHSFFSTTSSGARTQDYTSPYWRARGHARFFRYLTRSPSKSAAENVMSVSSRPLDRSTEQQPRVQAVKTPPPTTGKPETPRAEAAAPSTVRVGNASQIALRTGGKKPQRADVTTALAENNLAAGEILRAGDLEQLEQPVVVYRDLQVGTVEVKGKRGTAQIEFETVATVSADRTEVTAGHEEQEMGLQRTNKGWVLRPPSAKNVYVPRDTALRVLAARLAALTQNVATSERKEREQADIIRILNLLIE